MIDRIDFKNKKILYLSILFLTSICISGIFLYLERKILGISSTYHPDAANYINIDTFKTYKYLSTEFSLFKNLENFFLNVFSGTLYYSISNLFYEIQKISTHYDLNQYRNLIKLNILIYSLTNLIIFNAYIKNSKNYNFKIFVCILIYFFLPYKLHLVVNILKETLIIFFLILYLFYSNLYTLLISFLFGSSLRSLFSLYFLNFIDFKNLFSKKNYLIFFSILLTWIFVITFFVPMNNFTDSFLNFIEQRNLADMGGRDFDNIPNFSDKGYLGIFLRVILWPFFFLSGFFIFYSENIFFNILAIEIIIVQLLCFYCRKKFVISVGLLLFLVLLSLYANSFTAFFRYAYIAFQIVFLKNLFKI